MKIIILSFALILITFAATPSSTKASFFVASSRAGDSFAVGNIEIKEVPEDERPPLFDIRSESVRLQNEHNILGLIFPIIEAVVLGLLIFISIRKNQTGKKR